MFISKIGKDKTIIDELNRYMVIENEMNLDNDIFNTKQSNEQIILSTLINGISSIFQKNKIRIDTKKNIKEIKLTNVKVKKKYKVFGSWKEKGIIDKSICKYDCKGNLIEWCWYNKKDTLKKKLTNYYNSESKLTKQIFYNLANDINKEIIYKYSETGDLIEEKHYSNDKNFKGKYIYENIKEGVIKATVLDNKGEVIAKLKYIISENNKLIESSGYSSNDTLIIKFNCKYDFEGKKIEESCFVEKGVRSDKLLYKYNKNGIRIEDVSYNEKDNMRSKIKYKYDNNKNVIEEIYYSEIESAPPETGQMSYAHSGKENKLDILYKYNNEKHWIKRVYLQFEDSSQKDVSFRPINVTYREIEYY